jgi:alkyl sulfatase BDS1-like metallo-beta-lactamase superfamily hydrolase
MGGPDAVVAKARTSFDAGDYRWAAEVLNHVVFARPDLEAARELLADTYEQLGYGSENGTWRCAYLSGAHELRHGVFGTPVSPVSPDVVAQLTPEQLFASLAVRVDGPRCWDESIAIDVVLSDADSRYRLQLRNGVLTHTRAPQSSPADAVIHLATTDLPALVLGAVPASPESGGLRVEGDPSCLPRLLKALDNPDPDFAIVTP